MTQRTLTCRFIIKGIKQYDDEPPEQDAGVGGAQLLGASHSTTYCQLPRKLVPQF